MAIKAMNTREGVVKGVRPSAVERWPPMGPVAARRGWPPKRRPLPCGRPAGLGVLRGTESVR